MSSLLPGSPPQGVQLMPPGLFVFRGPLVHFFFFFIYLKCQVHLKYIKSHLLYSLLASTFILQDGMAPPQFSPSSDVPQYYPVPTSGPQAQIPFPNYPPQGPGFASPTFQPQHMPPHMPPSPGHMPPVEQPPRSPVEMPNIQSMPSSPRRTSLTPQKDFYDQMAKMVGICQFLFIYFL